jgi:aspartyl-tRNA(Asn)/glutamyl-tRNA(Gln) amidotransferase subunit A
MLRDLTIKKFHKGILAKEFSVSEIVSESLDAIEKENPQLNAFLSVFADEARAQARELDAAEDASKSPMLYGVPLAIKDNILIRGTRMTAASKILENYASSYNATVIEKLKRQSVVFVGKTNLDEFAMGSSTENSAYEVTKNPYDSTKVAGGSSGGSAAAVSAAMAFGALGTDTGGSIRQPASFCGVVGMKPTYGAVSRHGAAAMASSLDQIGPFAKTVEDAAHLFSAIAGHDPLDATSAPYDFSTVTQFNPEAAKKKIIGVPKEYFADGMDAYTAKEVEAALEIFRKNGYAVKEISLPHTKYAISCYYIVMPAEVSANLGRYDGLRYAPLMHAGMNADARRSKDSLLETYLQNRGEGFGEEVKRRILLGTFVLSSGYYDAYYAKAQKVRRKILEDFENAFNPSGGGVDVIFTPATPNPAFTVGEKADDPLAMYMEDVFTVPVNLAGLPAISIPVRDRSEYSKEKLPVNFQLIGRHFHEADIFNVGHQYEQLR